MLPAIKNNNDTKYKNKSQSNCLFYFNIICLIITFFLKMK